MDFSVEDSIAFTPPIPESHLFSQTSIFWTAWLLLASTTFQMYPIPKSKIPQSDDTLGNTLDMSFILGNQSHAK